MDYDNPEVEEQWCLERREEVAAHLAREDVEHGRIGEWPAWHLAPYVSIWAVESAKRPGWVGWWAISGDLPTDYVSASEIKHPREALQAFAARWREAASSMSQGQALLGFSVGPASEGPGLAPTLAARADLLQDLATDEELWDEL